MRAFSGVYVFRWNQLPSKFLSLSIKYLSAAKRGVNNLHFLRSSVDLPAPSEGRGRGLDWLEDVGKRREIREN